MYSHQNMVFRSGEFTNRTPRDVDGPFRHFLWWWTGDLVEAARRQRVTRNRDGESGVGTFGASVVHWDSCSSATPFRRLSKAMEVAVLVVGPVSVVRPELVALDVVASPPEPR
jgi:hypothetical protein